MNSSEKRSRQGGTKGSTCFCWKTTCALLIAMAAVVVVMTVAAAERTPRAGVGDVQTTVERFLPKQDASVDFENRRRMELLFEEKIHRNIDPIFRMLFREPDMMEPGRIRGDFERLLTQYARAVDQGRALCSKRRIVLTGCLRNGASRIHYWRQWVAYFVVPYWEEYRVVIVENNSKDDTRRLLLEWAQYDSNVVILCDALHHNHNVPECELAGAFHTEYTGPNLSPEPQRIRKMSFLRNLCREYIRQHYRGWDYVLTIDWDLKGDLLVDGVLHALSVLSEPFRGKAVDAVACNGMLWDSTRASFRYYDSFAYIDLQDDIFFPSSADKSQHDKYVHDIVTDSLTRSMEPHLVRSAFGGACLYRMAPYVNAQYGFHDFFFSCEHAHLHEKMRIVIDPCFVFLILENNAL